MRNTRRTRRRIVAMRYPTGLEYSYRTTLLGVVRKLQEALKKHMSPVVRKMALEVNNRDGLQQDAWDDDLTDALNKVARDMMQPVNAAIRD